MALFLANSLGRSLCPLLCFRLRRLQIKQTYLTGLVKFQVRWSGQSVFLTTLSSNEGI